METVQDVREKFKTMLSKVPEGTRMKLKKENVEFFLFDIIRVNGEKVKLPVCSGKFLSKLDLSEVDFSNVYWGANVDPKLKYRFDSGGIIDYSNTNARINLAEGFSPKSQETITYINCNFENTDLSPTKFETDAKIFMWDANFKNSGMTLDEKVVLCPIKSNLENTNLKSAKIPTKFLFQKYLKYGEESYTNFHNSGANFNLTEKEREELKSQPGFAIMEYMQQDYWGNCRYNGEIVTNKRTEAEVDDMLKRFEGTESEIINQMLNENANILQGRPGR